MNALIKPIFDEEAVREDLEETLMPEDYLLKSELSFFLLEAQEIIELLIRNGDIPEFRQSLKKRYEARLSAPIKKERETHLDIKVEKKRQDFYLI